MRVRITLSILDDNYLIAEPIPPVDCLFDGKIRPDTVAGVQQLAAEVLERHTRTHKQFDGLAHWAQKD